MTRHVPLPTSARPHRERPQYRPPIGVPKGRENRRVGAVVSLLLHLLLLYLIVTPFVVHHPIFEIAQGAGGPGPAGGGGGGRGGSGGQTRRETERLEFISVKPAAKPQAATVRPPTPKPRPVPPPVMPKLEITPTAVSVLPTVAAPAPIALDVASTVGVGGGSGHDGSAGNGPGRGGGVGSGVGSGRGSGTGPGTGGGTQANYPPQPTEVFLPPYPIPGDVKGFHLVAEFDVDSTGRVLSMDFTPTRDRGYNRRLADVFRSFRFRPGTTPDGTPIRMKAQIVVDLY
jgi:periplasmic protein TonB